MLDLVRVAATARPARLRDVRTEATRKQNAPAAMTAAGALAGACVMRRQLFGSVPV